MLAAFCVCAAVAPAAHAASVTVQKLDASARTFQLSELGTDVSQPYAVRDAGGERTVQVKGTSLSALLREADADLIGARSIEISGGGKKRVLTPEQLSGGGAGSPVVFEDAGQAAFLRPAYSSDDLNGSDRIAAPVLTVRLLKSTALEVEARASTATAKVGQKVTFSAEATGGAGQQFTYNWTFDDGSRRGSGARVTHTFREAGSYNVVVGARTANNQTGDSAIVRVRVGAAPEGPDRAGGGTDSSASAPDSGTASGGGSGVSGGTGSAAQGPAQSPPVRSGTPRRSPSAKPSPSPATPAGDAVEGTLLAGGVTPPPEQRPAARQRAARTGNDSAGDGGFGLPRAAWGGLAALALAGAGGLVEWRQPLLRRRAAA